MSFDFGSLEKKSSTAKATKPTAGSNKPAAFDFSNLGEEKSQAPKPQTVNIQPAQPAKPAKPAKPAQPQPDPFSKLSQPVEKSAPTASTAPKLTPKPTPKPAPKPAPTVSKPVAQTKSTSTSSAPTLDFGTVGSSTPKATSKTTSKPSSKTTYGTHTAKDRHKGKRGQSPLDALKDLNPMALSAGIGGIVLLIVVVCFCCMGGGEGNKKTAKPTKTEKQIALEAANKYSNSGEYQKAIKEYEKAYKLDPADNYAPDQISIIYRNNLHDEAQADHWKSISDRNQVGNLKDMEGLSARAYAERAAKKKAKQGKR